jgi:hypothetical protein
MSARGPREEINLCRTAFLRDFSLSVRVSIELGVASQADRC